MYMCVCVCAFCGYTWVHGCAFAFMCSGNKPDSASVPSKQTESSIAMEANRKSNSWACFLPTFTEERSNCTDALKTVIQV